MMDCRLCGRKKQGNNHHSTVGRPCISFAKRRFVFLVKFIARGKRKHKTRDSPASEEATGYLRPWVPAGSPSRSVDVAVCVFDINQPSLPTPFSMSLSISLFMALSTVFHSTISPDNSPLSHSVLSVLSLPYWSFQL